MGFGWNAGRGGVEAVAAAIASQVTARRGSQSRGKQSQASRAAEWHGDPGAGGLRQSRTWQYRGGLQSPAWYWQAAAGNGPQSRGMAVRHWLGQQRRAANWSRNGSRAEAGMAAASRFLAGIGGHRQQCSGSNGMQRQAPQGKSSHWRARARKASNGKSGSAAFADPDSKG